MAKRCLEQDVGSSVDIQPIPKKDHKIILAPKDIVSPDTHASVHAIVFSLSATKTKGTFFDGELTDGVKIIRVVGFDKNQHAKLQDFHIKQIPVTLSNCQIKFNNVYNKLEVTIHSYTNVQPSTATFTVHDPKTFGSDLIELATLTDKNEYDKVTVRAQVLKIADPAKVGKGLTKQEVTIADATEAALLTLWESDIGKVQNGCSYQFNRLIVRTYRGNRQLSFPAFGASIEPINDIGEVADDSFDLDHDNLLEGAQVMGVTNLEFIYTCMQCKKGTVKPRENSNIGTCQQCQTTQKLNTKKQTCKVFVETLDQQHVSLRVYEDMLKAICKTNNSTVTCEDLLSAPLFDLKYNDYHVITNVSRPGQ